MKRAMATLLFLAGLSAGAAAKAEAGYQLYAAPTPTATPVPDDTKWFAFHKPYWSLGLKGGASQPLGDLAAYNGGGPSYGVDIIYQGTRTLGTDFFFLYSSQPYKVGGGATPFNNMQLGLRLLYEVSRVEALNAWVGAGAAYVLTQRTRQVLRQPVTDPPAYDAEAQNTGGMGLVFCVGASYLFGDAWAITGDCTISNIALAGGTADNIMLALPTLGLRYDF
jgi:hypothetical protein